jgi:malate dehydrogenase
MSTVSVIGAGELGGAVADALARADCVSRVRIVDAAAGGSVAAGKALDIQQSGAVKGFHTRLEGTDDQTRAIGSAVCVIADRFGGGEWQGDEGLAMLTRLLPMLGSTPIVFAGAAHGELLRLAAREAHVPRERLIGSAPEALASAVTSIVAMEAACAAAEVTLTVLGTPPDGFVVPWSEASIGGLALEHVLSQVQLNRLEARAARLWPAGPFTLGLAAARVAAALLSSSRRSYSVLMVLDGEFGARGHVGALPALLSATGIVHARVPTLSGRERVQLETALRA